MSKFYDDLMTLENALQVGDFPKAVHVACQWSLNFDNFRQWAHIKPHEAEFDKLLSDFIAKAGRRHGGDWDDCAALGQRVLAAGWKMEKADATFKKTKQQVADLLA